MTAVNLLQKAEQAFAGQNNQQGLALLREYSVQCPQDTEQLYRLAVIEEQIGSGENAAAAYLQCIANDSNYIQAYLYGGYYFQQNGQMERALALYSLGNDREPIMSMLHQNEKLSYETRLRSHSANIALRNHFSELHITSVKKEQGTTRITNAIWPQTHNKNLQYVTKHQQPHLFYIPELPAMPIHNSADFSWSSLLEERFDELTSEFTQLLSLINDKGVPYLDDGYNMKGFEALTGSKNWTALNFYKDGVANEQLLALMPKTAALLAELPLYKMNENPFEVFFSLLKPEQHIAPHFGLSNHSLTVHLPIIVPKGGYLTVAGEQVPWQKGKVIIFDDSFEHEAINPSKEERVVLIFSIWHPSLTIDEQKDIIASFTARANWLKNRYLQLDCDNSA